MTKFSATFLMLILSCSSHAVAQDRMETAQVAVKKMAEETLECAAYYDIVSVALVHSNARQMALEYVQARKLAVDRAESLSQGIVNARYNILVRDMARKVVSANAPKRTDEKLANVLIEDISVLRDRHAKLCKQILEDPGSRAKYWMEQAGEPTR